MSFSLLSLRKRFDHPRSRFCLTQHSVARRDKKGCEGDYKFSWILGETKRQNSFQVQSLRIPIGVLKLYHPEHFPSIQPNPNESLFSASRECF